MSDDQENEMNISDQGSTPATDQSAAERELESLQKRKASAVRKNGTFHVFYYFTPEIVQERGADVVVHARNIL